MLTVAGIKRCAKVVLPAPFGPAMMYMARPDMAFSGFIFIT
jgi:hypothetical protein